MKRILISFLVGVFVLSIMFVGAGCKEESAQAEEVTEEVATGEEAEEATEEVATGEEAEEVAMEEVTITFTHFDIEENDAYDKLILMFEQENPNIKVEMEAYTNDEYLTAMKARLLGGDVDIYRSQPGPAFEEAIRGGYAYDITDKDFVKAFFPDMIEATCTYDGKVYATIDGFTVFANVYNKKMFDEYNIPYPEMFTSFEDMKEIAQEFTKNGIVPTTFGLADSWLSDVVSQTFLAQMIPENPDNYWEVVEDGKGKITDSVFRKVAEAYDEFSNAGIIDPNAAGVNYSESQALFLQEQMPIMFTGSWSLGAFKMEDPNLETGLFVSVAPGVDANNAAYQFVSGALLVVNAKSEDSKLNAALKFMEFLSSEEAFRVWSVDTDRPSPIEGLEIKSENIEKTLEITNSDHLGTLCVGQATSNAEIGGVLQDVSAQLLIPGEKDIDAILEEGQQKIDNILAAQ